jgi:hypothetical protein
MPGFNWVARSAPGHDNPFLITTPRLRVNLFATDDALLGGPHSRVMTEFL